MTTSVLEQNRLSRSNQIESGVSVGVGGKRLSVAYVGNIPEAITDDIMERLLTACGPVTHWKRVLDANNMPKSFGFCDFGSADAMNRALALLNELPLSGGKRLNVKIDDATKAYLVKYEEAMKSGEVEMSSKEADLQACNIILTILREKNLLSAMEAMERKISILTAEEPEEGEALEYEEPLNDNYKDNKRDDYQRERERRGSREERRPPSKDRERRVSRDSDLAQKAFKEREARWEEREKRMAQRYQKEADIEFEEKMRKKEEEDFALKYLESLDDYEWLIDSLDRLGGIFGDREPLTLPNQNVKIPDFYYNRELWLSRRGKEREREEAFDKRDEETENSIKAKTCSSPVKENEKRERPKAGEYIQDDNEEDTIPHRKKPLIDKDYSFEELLSKGYSKEEAADKTKQLYKEKVAKLIERIPTDQESLFQWNVEWKHLDCDKLKTLVRKKVAESINKIRGDERQIDRISNSLAKQIQQHSSPESIIAWIYEDGHLLDRRSSRSDRKESANVFVAILWRYIVFETEAISYNLKAPSF